MPSMSYETSIAIEAPAEAVYTYVADFPRHIEWNHQPQQMLALTDGPVQVGSRYQTQESNPRNLGFAQKVMFAVMGPIIKIMFGAPGHTVAEITALEPNERVAWKAHMPSKRKGDLMRMNWEIRLQPQDGVTHVVQCCEVAPPEGSPLAKFLNDDMVEQSKEEVYGNLSNLKAIVEAQFAT